MPLILGSFLYKLSRYARFQPAELEKSHLIDIRATVTIRRVCTSVTKPERCNKRVVTRRPELQWKRYHTRPGVNLILCGVREPSHEPTRYRDFIQTMPMQLPVPCRLPSEAPVFHGTMGRSRNARSHAPRSQHRSSACNASLRVKIHTLAG